MILSLVILVSGAVVLVTAGFIAGREWIIQRYLTISLAPLPPMPTPDDEWADTLAGLPKVPAHEPGPRAGDFIIWQHPDMELVERDAPELPRTGWQQLDGGTWMPPVETLYGRRAGDALSRLLWEAALMPAGPAALPAPQAALEAPRSTDG